MLCTETTAPIPHMPITSLSYHISIGTTMLHSATLLQRSMKHFVQRINYVDLHSDKEGSISRIRTFPLSLHALSHRSLNRFQMSCIQYFRQLCVLAVLVWKTFKLAMDGNHHGRKGVAGWGEEGVNLPKKQIGNTCRQP